MMAKRRKKKHSVLRIIALLVIVLSITCLGGIYWYYQKSLEPVQNEPEAVAFRIDEGSTLTTVTNKLKDDGIIRDAKMAYYYGRLNHLTGVKAGNFTLDKSWDVPKILAYLNDDIVAQKESVKVTIVEGDWAKDAAKKISAACGVPEAELLTLWNDQEYIRSLMPRYPFLTEEMFKDDIRIYLEGYLAPETYLFDVGMTSRQITEMILDQSLRVYDQFKDAIAASRFSIHEAYTFASIIQYEAGSNMEDMRLVSGVFHNRLDVGMPLQASATVCYAVNFDKETDQWQVCEVNADFDSPYNTYRYNGLTPGAIENAGTLAFEAALNPTPSDYYYFMTDVSTGEFHYARTLEEHNQNVYQYLR